MKVAFKTIIRRILKFLLFLLPLFLLQNSWAAVITWTGAQNNNWNISGNWDLGIPGSGDDVIIANGDATVVNSAFTINSLTITNGSATLSNNLTVNTTISLSSGTSISIGTQTLTSGGDITGAGTITIGTGTLDANADVGNSTTALGTLTCSGSSIINVAADWAVDNFTRGTGNVIFDGSGDQTIETNNFFYDITVNNASTATLTTNSNFLVVNQFILDGGNIDIPSGITVTLYGAGINVFERQNNGNFTTSSSGVFSFSFTSTISTDANINFPGLKFVQEDLVIPKILTITGGTLTVQGNVERGGNHSLSFGTGGDLEYASGRTLIYSPSGETMTASINEWPSNTSVDPENVTITSNLGVNLNDGNTRTVEGTLTLQQSSGNLSISNSTALNINGTLDRRAAGTVGLSISGGGSITYASSGSFLKYNTSSNTTVGQEWDDTNPPENVSVNISPGTLTGSTSKTIPKDLTLSVGIINLGSNVLTVEGTVIGSLISGNATIDDNTELYLGDGGSGGSDNQEISGTLTLHKLRINKTIGGDGTGTTVQLTGSSILTFTSGIPAAYINIEAGIFDLNGEGRISGKANTNLSISSGATLKTGGTSLVGFNGYTLSGTVEYSGSGDGPESIPDLNFTDLTINNTSTNGVQVSSGATPTVSGTLTLTNGILQATSSNTLTLNSESVFDASTDGGSDASFIDGPLTINGSGTKTFPIGDGSTYRPVQITNANSGSHTFEVFNINPGGTPDGTTLARISSVRYWRGIGSLSNGVVELAYGSDDGVNPDTTNLRVASSSSSGGQYVSKGNAGATYSEFANSIRTGSNYPITSLEYYTLGSETNDHSLPVSLSSFDVKLASGGVVLSWVTKSELQNEGFNIYRKETGVEADWLRINPALIPGQGNTAIETRYEFIDKTAVAGTTYQYKLESVSYSGYRVDEKIVEVSVPLPKQFAMLGNYPNPFNPNTQLKFQLPEQHQVTIYIYDTMGHLVKKLLANESFAQGEHSVTWDATDEMGRNVASGMYIYRFAAGKYVKSGKMLLMK